jgi:hypothetical protein
MHQVLGEEANAAARDTGADRFGVDAGIDRVEGVSTVLIEIEIERAGAERFVEATPYR